MTSSTPPRLATWILLRFVPGGENEALAGDLLESFRAGRSGGWYYRQALMACLVSWGLALKARLPLVLFALAWSMSAPAWELLCGYVGSSRMIASLSLFGGFWILPALIVWTVLHAFFVWVGALVYSAAQGTFGPPLRGNKMRQGLLVSAVVLDVVYAVTFILVDLYQSIGTVILSEVWPFLAKRSRKICGRSSRLMPRTSEMGH